MSPGEEASPRRTLGSSPNWPAPTSNPAGPPTDPAQTARTTATTTIAASQPTAAQFKQRLLELAEDPTAELIAGVGSKDIEYGRCTAGLIGGQTAFLIGTKRFHPPIPAVQ